MMTEIKVKDVFPVSCGIMSAISDSAGYGFNSDMDLRLVATCGMRCITPIVELLLDGSTTLTSGLLERLAALILSEYRESWDRVKNTLTMEYNPLSASEYNEEEHIDSEGENTDNSNEMKQDDVSTVDISPASYVTDGKRTSESSGSGTNRSTSIRTLKRTSNSTSYKPVDLIQSEIEMRIQNKFTSRVLDDVKNYIAMQIY